jgi:hypothetical protein
MCDVGFRFRSVLGAVFALLVLGVWLSCSSSKSSPPPVTYTITASAGPNGAISPSGTVTLNQGASQTFTITPGTGYVVDVVTVDGASQGAVATYAFASVGANHTISATFKAQYTLTATAGANGAISPSGAVLVVAGASQTFTVTPATGYLVDVVTVDGVSQGSVTTYTFASVVANHTIGATFKAVPGGVAVTPGAVAQTTLTTANGTSVTFTFPANALSQAAVATMTSLDEAALTVPAPSSHSPLGVPAGAAQALAATSYVLAFKLELNPVTITTFNVPVAMGGNVGTAATAGSLLNLAILRNGLWVPVSNFQVGASGGLTQTLASVQLPGVVTPGTYLVYKGASVIPANYGIALVADDGNGSGPAASAVQVISLFDAQGVPLAKPTVKYLAFPNAYDLDGQALTPDGKQGILVDGGNTVRFFSAVDTGVPVASTTTVDISAYGGDGDAVAIMPDGDEAVVSGDSSSVLLVISGIVSGQPKPAITIPIAGYRDGLVIAADGKVMLARGTSGLTVFTMAAITPATGALGGTIAHTFTNKAELTTVPSPYGEDGRDGMAISRTDSTRAVVIGSGATTGTPTLALLTGLTTTPTVAATLAIPGVYSMESVDITYDGKFAIIGTNQGLVMVAGIDTGTLALVGPGYAPNVTTGGSTVPMAYVNTLGLTLDGKYVVVCCNYNLLLVIPFSASGFGAPVGQLDNVAVPSNDQMVMH